MKEVDIRIDDVTFLVGGNSSGKTSFIYLVEMLTSSSFRMGFDYYIDKKITGYDDIVSPYTGRNKITIGYIYEEDNESDTLGRRDYILMDIQPLPRRRLEVVKLSVSNGRKSVFIQKKSGRLIRKFTDDLGYQGAEKFIKEHRHATKGYSSDFMPTDVDFLDTKSLQVSVIIFDQENKRVDTSLAIASPALSSKSYGPMRSAPLHYYHEYGDTFEETGQHIPALLREMYEKGEFKTSDLIKQVREFGMKSGLFDDLDLKLLSSTEKKSPYKIVFRKNGVWFSIDELGYGVSQALPLIVDALLSTIEGNDKMLISVQQPEVHLHPQAQAEFGELVQSLSSKGTKFLLETHSDFVIDRFRVKQNLSEVKVSSSILYFSNNRDGNNIDQISIDEDGSISDTPDGYREFFSREQDRIFDLI